MKIKLSKSKNGQQNFSFKAEDIHINVNISTAECITLRDSIDALLATSNNEEYSKEYIESKLDKIVTIDTRGMHKLITEINSESMIYFLIICQHFKKQKLSQKIYGSISRRAAEMLKDDVDIKNTPMQLKEAVVLVDYFIEKAQKLEKFGLLCFKENEEEWIG